jgi:hypothetical protein
MKKIIIAALSAIIFIVLIAAVTKRSKSTITLPGVQQIKVTTGDISSITSSGAVCSYYITAVNGKYEHGVCVNKTPNPEVKKNGSFTFTGTCDKSVAQNRSCSAKMVLKSKVKYYVRAFERTSNGTIVYGNELSFTTL